MKQAETLKMSGENGYVYASVGFVRQYTNTISLLWELSKRARRLLEFSLFEMDENNIIRTGKYFIGKLNSFLSNNSIATYSDDSVKKALTELVKKDVFIKERRGTYLVNPLFFDAGNEYKRIKKIQVMMEFKAGVRTSINVQHFYKDLIKDE